MFTIEARDHSSGARAGLLIPRTASCARRPSCRSRRRPPSRACSRAKWRAGLRNGARQHLPSPRQPRPGGDRAPRRPSPLHGLGAADHHRLGRLSGLLDGPRPGGGRDQGLAPARPRARPRTATRRAKTATRSARAPSSSIEEEGVRFRSYVDGREFELTPESSMAVQAALGSDIALAFDECTPFHVDREYTQRSTERTHRWLERCIAWHGEHGPRGPAPLRDLPGRRLRGPPHAPPRAPSPRADATASRSAARSGATQEQMWEVVGFATSALGGGTSSLARHLLGIGEVDDLIRGSGWGSTPSTARCPRASAATGARWCTTPRPRGTAAAAGGSTSRSAAGSGGSPRSRPGCPCPACSTGLSRAYLSYLVRAKELTAFDCSAPTTSRSSPCACARYARRGSWRAACPWRSRTGAHERRVPCRCWIRRPDGTHPKPARRQPARRATPSAGYFVFSSTSCLSALALF